MGVLRQHAAVALLAACVTTLSACGFHLRGQAPLPEAMQRTHLTGTGLYGPLRDEVMQALAGAGGRLVDDPRTAGSVLRIEGERFHRRVLSVAADRRVNEYSLTYDLAFSLYAPDGSVLVPSQQVSVTREYAFDRDRVLGTGQEEAVLRREMRDQAVRQMLRRLRAAAD